MDDITAEYAVEALVAPPELRCIPATSFAAKTDMGRVREHNEDKYEFFIPEDNAMLAARGKIFLVCDGMGGHSAGQIASELTIKTFLGTYHGHPSQLPSVAARAAAEAANRFVRDLGQSMPQYRGMGTTLTGLCLVQDKAVLVQAGDSRCYRLRSGDLIQLSPEHTWIAEMVSQGHLSLEEASSHPYRHMITKAVGQDVELGPDILEFDLEPGDKFLLCSDGLTNHVNDVTLFQVLDQFSPSAACMELVRLALEDGGSDNCTVMIIRVDSIDPV